MRTTVDIPEPLLRQAKARAALEGRRLEDVVNDALIRLLSTPEENDSTDGEPHLPPGVEWETAGRFRLPLIRSRNPGTTRIDPAMLKDADSDEDEERHATIWHSRQ